MHSEIQNHGRYKIDIKRGPDSPFKDLGDETFEFDNICVNQGLVAMLNVIFAAQSNVAGWYLGVFSNNYTPVASDTASSIVGNAGEFTGYSGGTRAPFSPAAASGTPSITNSASAATFTFTGSATLTGAFLISNPTPGANTGVLFSAAQFSSSKSVGNTDQMTVTYTLQATSS